MTTVKELRQRAKLIGLTRTSKLRKNQLLELINNKLSGKHVPYEHISSEELFKSLIYTKAEHWDFAILRHLSKKHLASLCQLFGYSFSGNKAKLIDRIQSGLEIRIQLQKFKNNEIQSLADSYKGKELKAMIKQARRARKCCLVGTKYGMASCLISWRNNCRMIGKQNLQAAIEYHKEKRQQAVTKEVTKKELVTA